MNLDELPEEMTLGPSRAKWLGAAFVSALLAVAGLGVIMLSFNLGLAMVVVFGIGLVVSISQLSSRASRLLLKRDGFAQVLFGKTLFYQWSEVSEFSVWGRDHGFEKNEFVGFTVLEKSDGHVGQLKAETPQSTLGDTFGKDAEELAELMNLFRRRAMRSQ